MTNAESWENKKSGIGDANYQMACLRLPQFPLQILLQQKPEWRDKRVVWLPNLKADARVRYLTPEAHKAGVEPGGRYATVLGVVPNLLAGTSSEDNLRQADDHILEVLRRFTPQIRRRSQNLEKGLYLLDASGLKRAFHGMRAWAKGLLQSLHRAGWQARLAVGFTAFATEMATYHLSKERPIRLFQSIREEERRTLQTPLSAFSLLPEQVSRLRRFQVITLGDFLKLDEEEIRSRFGADLLEFYQKAAGAIFTSFPPLPEPEPLIENFGFLQPVSELAPILETSRAILEKLLPSLLQQEEAVASVRLQFLNEDNSCRDQVLRPTYPTADLNWLMSLIRLRLEKHFQRYPLRWGCRVERLIVEITGEPDPEKQGDLFTDWALDVSSDGEERLAPRDKNAGLWALSQVRAEFGERSLVRAHLADHHLPERDHVWKNEKEEMEWLTGWTQGRKGKRNLPPLQPEQDSRVRRILYKPVGLSRRSDWSAQYGPYSVNGGWWGTSYAREYCFCQKDEQTAWLYQDLDTGRYRVQGWLQ